MRPCAEGLSDNIKVYSVIGRFLEHNRIYYFENATSDKAQKTDNQKVFISSADWMPRNLRNRIELCTPIFDEKIKSNIINDLNSYLNDDTDAWIMQSDGTYVQSIHVDSDTQPHNAQQCLLESLAEPL